jgi:hypothetical protein
LDINIGLTLVNAVCPWWSEPVAWRRGKTAAVGEGSPSPATHDPDRAGYRAALAMYVDMFERVALGVSFWTPHHLWSRASTCGPLDFCEAG